MPPKFSMILDNFLTYDSQLPLEWIEMSTTIP